MRNKTVSVWLDSETLKTFGAIAKGTGPSQSLVIADVIPERYVEERSMQIVVSAKAMKRFQNGEAKFTNHEQVQGWLESTGTP